MRKIIIRNVRLFTALVAVLAGLFITNSSEISAHDTLRDDVAAMITDASTTPHVSYIIDTSESMNVFAYSDYVHTCEDSLRNIDHSINLCWSSYNQCRRTEDNAMCGATLNCHEIAANCNNLEDARSDLREFCWESDGQEASIEYHYKEPPKTSLPDTWMDLRLKFVGPWTPEEFYTHDYCFYNWTMDTGGDVLADTTSDHWTNPSGAMGSSDGGIDFYATDRRDWDCMSDGMSPISDTGKVTGLWLNWKYATALDAIKIILADAHEFSYPPRTRGNTECIHTEYYPRRSETYLTGDVCYADTIEFDGLNASDKALFISYVRSRWEFDKEFVSDAPCDPEIPFRYMVPKPPSTEPDETSGCEVCRQIVKHTPCESWNEPGCTEGTPGCVCESYAPGSDFIEVTVECKEDDPGAVFDNMGPWVGEGDVSVNYSCCMHYYCNDPKCRDDDKTCFSEGGVCNLGYYSTFDQDQNHCCEPLVCLEEGDEAEGCNTEPVFIPGPGNTATTEFEISVGMGGLSEPDQTYGNASVTSAVITNFDITGPEKIDRIVLELLWGCNGGGFPENEFSSITFDGDPWPSAPFAVAGTALTGCASEGYKVGVRTKLYHKGAPHYGEADVAVEVELRSEWTVFSRVWISIFDKDQPLFEEIKEEVYGGGEALVNEYECKTTMYHRQSYVENGGSSNCNWHKLRKPDGTPYERCVYPSHTRIAADQWGTTKTACSWLCRDQAVYDEVWKCRDFFSQMDSIMRGGPGVCKDVCYNKSNSLEDCCQCIHNNNNLYNYLNLEPPERVWFADPPEGDNPRQYNCSSSGFVEGITSDGGRVYIQGFMAEVVKGHIQETGDASNKLVVTDDSAQSPYTGWYGKGTEGNPGLGLSLIDSEDAFLEKTVTSFFKTGDQGTREVACIYDILAAYDGTDCDECDPGGCCSIDIASDQEYCEFPTFWAMIPKVEGGELIVDATDSSRYLGNMILNDLEKPRFRTTIANLKARGGATLGETLYDLWRYLGGMRAVYDPNFRGEGTAYLSPYQDTDPSCFINEAVIISGGQPHFDTNEKILEDGFLSQSAPAGDPPFTVPYVESDPDDLPDGDKPYQKTNWYLSSIIEVAEFVTTEDFFWRSDQIEEDHPDTVACRTDYSRNIYGFRPNSVDCLPYDGTMGVANRDDTGINTINRIHTVAIGEWTLAPLYASAGGEESEYLIDSLLKEVVEVTNPPGGYYGLTVDSPDSDGTLHSFNDLTALFQALSADGLEFDVVSGRPHWTSGAIQPFGPYQTFRGPSVYFPAAFPIDNQTSRFWFGNLKKYYLDGSGGADCPQIEEGYSYGMWESKGGLAPGDCFAPNDDGNDISSVTTRIDGQEQVRPINAGGAAKLLADRVDTLSCDSAPCYMDVGDDENARRIYFDGDLFPSEKVGLKLLKDRSPDERNHLRQLMGGFTVDDMNKVFDYIYGFDAYGEFGGDPTARRYSGLPGDGTIEVDDPFDPDIGNKIRIRPLILGAIIHSNPVAVHYENPDPNSEELLTRIYVGANDGMLHSFDQDGHEVFGYIPSPVLPKLANINSGNPGILFNSTVDGPITLFHIDRSGDGVIMQGESAYLIFGYRRGGTYYTVINVSDPDNPEFVQHISLDGAQSWGKPLIFRKPGGYYLAVPGGYDGGCFDTLVPDCDPGDVKGNNVKIFRYIPPGAGETSGSFDSVYNFGHAGHDNMRGNDNLWMRVSFAADPVAVNTNGLLLKDTEFVYFLDISGTVYRLDTRSNNYGDWTLRVVFTMRDAADRDTIDWQDGIRSYVNFATFPPLTTKYPSFSFTDPGDPDAPIRRLPIPVVTGNMVSTTAAEPDKVIAFYDMYDWDEIDPPLAAEDMYVLDLQDEDEVEEGVPDHTEKDGWKLILPKDTEKVITRPLIYYDRFQSYRYTLWFNTYVPAEYGYCKDFGTTRNYGRDLITGGRGHEDFDGLYWEAEKASISSDIGVVMTPEGERLAFGAGDRIFWLDKPFVFQRNLLDIIKWYELY